MNKPKCSFECFVNHAQDLLHILDSRAFYADGELVDRVMALCATSSWDAQANMHFGHFQRGYAWLPVPDRTDLAAYTSFWQKNQDLIATVYRSRSSPDGAKSWDALLDRLLAAGIVASREAFDRDFVDTNRNKADVRPGLEIFRFWPIEKAESLDETGHLVMQIREAFNLTLTTFQLGATAGQGSPTSPTASAPPTP